MVPPYCVSTSPGRWAVAEGMFSAMGTVAITSIGRFSAATSSMVAITAAAPAMSEVMWCIWAAGLMEIPPVSKVMPLPISATDGVLPFPAFPPRCTIRTNRGAFTDPWPTPMIPP